MIEKMRAIGELIRTQDNRATDAPVFIVQQKKRRYGLSGDYAEDSVWVFEGDEANGFEEAMLTQLKEENKDVPDGWELVGYTDTWEFVTACFTEKGCEDYIAANGHNLAEHRIYADGSYRNEEFRAIREFLMGLK